MVVLQRLIVANIAFANGLSVPPASKVTAFRKSWVIVPCLKYCCVTPILPASAISVVLYHENEYFWRKSEYIGNA